MYYILKIYLKKKKTQRENIKLNARQQIQFMADFSV